MKYVNRFRVAPGSKVKLKNIDPAFKDHHANHKEAAAEIEQYQTKLRDLQELFYADGRCSLLICLQGMDTGGKDGTINHVGRDESAGLSSVAVQAANCQGIGPRFPVAGPSACAGKRRGGHLQPLSL